VSAPQYHPEVSTKKAKLRPGFLSETPGFQRFPQARPGCVQKPVDRDTLSPHLGIAHLHFLQYACRHK
jgi:hypothetical protein